MRGSGEVLLLDVYLEAKGIVITLLARGVRCWMSCGLAACDASVGFSESGPSLFRGGVYASNEAGWLIGSLGAMILS